MNLQLSLRRKWFEMTKAGIKTEDYREITPYWCNRLLFQNGMVMKKEWWEKYLNSYGSITIKNALKTSDSDHRLSFKQFDCNIMTLGYPSSNDLERILIYEHEAVEISEGYVPWGAEPGKLYFVIKHGAIIKDLLPCEKKE